MAVVDSEWPNAPTQTGSITFDNSKFHREVLKNYVNRDTLCDTVPNPPVIVPPSINPDNADSIFDMLGCTEAMTRKYISETIDDIRTFDRKQRDYGSGNIADFGETGVLVRANDKMQRLKNLHKRGGEPANESIDDSWRDLTVYGVIARLVRKGVWK